MGGGRIVPDPPANSASDPTLNFTVSTQLPDGAGKGCYYSPNLQLGTALDSNFLGCDPGFYCPYLNQSDPTTLPVYCPPSPGCATYRLTSLPCSAQGRFEPIICKPGYYCPDYKTMIICPKGYFCPTGTVAPYQCTIFTLCPEGSISQTVYGFFIVMAIFDGLIALLMLTKFNNGFFKGLFRNWFQPVQDMIRGPAFALKQTARKQMGTGTGGRSIHSDSEVQNTDVTVLMDAFRESFRSRDLRMNFKFENLALELKNGKRILQGVTGDIRAKRMTAIIGPSGAGSMTYFTLETTFMNVLMGKVSRTGGRLFINGEASEMHLYRKIIGYVPQEDIMISQLTVRENILHSARIRLPRHWTSKQIEHHVDNVLKALNLTHVANTIIGDETSRGVSGGQRKRVNIGMELAAAPLAIFLDEPTSGLDSTSALDLASVLSNIASLGLTIVAVIHQPRIEIFRKFDDVLMIAPGGRAAYMGPVSMSQQYFETLGYEFDPTVNMSDILMDILAGKGANPEGNWTSEQLVELWESRHTRDFFVEPPKRLPTELTIDVEGSQISSSVFDVNQLYANIPPPGTVEHWMVSVDNLTLSREITNVPIPEAPCESPPRDEAVPDVPQNDSHSRLPSDNTAFLPNKNGTLRSTNNIRRSLNRSSSSVEDDGRNLDQEFHLMAPQVVNERGASFLKQVYYCHQRSLIQQSRLIMGLVLEIIVALFAGMLMGISTTGKVKELMNGIYYGIYVVLSPAPLDLLSLYGLLIGIAIALAGAPSGVKVFGEEKPVFWREAASGHSRLAYFLGKTIATMYRLILTSLHFTGLYMLLAKPILSPYIQYILVLFQFWGVYGISCIISVIVRRENASLLSVVICLFAAVFCGYGPSLVQARRWGLLWIWELSFNKWAAEAQYAASIAVYKNRLDVDLMAGIYGYSLTQINMDLVMGFVLGIVSRAVGFGLMCVLNRDKQR